MKVLARHLLLAALLLKALTPLGWMPGAPALGPERLGEAAFIICTADGQIQHGVPGKDESSRHQQPCAFAAAHVMAAAEVTALIAPSLPAEAVADLAAFAPPHLAGSFTPQSPRGPPISA